MKLFLYNQRVAATFSTNSLSFAFAFRLAFVTAGGFCRNSSFCFLSASPKMRF